MVLVHGKIYRIVGDVSSTAKTLYHTYVGFLLPEQ